MIKEEKGKKKEDATVERPNGDNERDQKKRKRETCIVESYRAREAMSGFSPLIRCIRIGVLGC